MATLSSSWTSTAANVVAGCTGGGVWSLAMAGSASHSKNSGIARKVLIVLDCIIMRLDRGTTNSVTHDSIFLQYRAAGSAGDGIAVVALADCHYTKISGGAG